jgi:hypothetical protein
LAKLTAITPLQNWAPARKLQLPAGLQIVRLADHYEPNFDDWYSVGGVLLNM